MKKHINKISLLLAIVMIPAMSFAQYCNNFHQKKCYRSDNEMFRYNGQSKSALFTQGQTSELSIVVYTNQDYRISLCMDKNFGSQIKFKVYESKKVQVEKVYETTTTEDEMETCSSCSGSGETDGEECYDCDGAGEKATGNELEIINKETKLVTEKQKHLLYDNSEDDFSNEIEFSVETTRRLMIEISMPDAGEGTSNNKRSKLKDDDMGCVGVLLEHMATPKAGFNGSGF
jgi:hypothetical protein